MNLNFNFTLELVDFDSEISEVDAGFVRDLIAFNPDDLVGNDPETANITLFCEADIFESEEATQHSPPCPSFAQLTSIKICKGQDIVELDINIPNSLEDQIAESALDEWRNN